VPKVILTSFDDNYKSVAFIDNIENKNCFTYTDEDKNNVEICVFEDGLCVFKETSDYLLELHLRNDPYVKITSSEGILKINAKVVEFCRNNDILVMRYLVEGQDKKIEIFY